MSNLIQDITPGATLRHLGAFDGRGILLDFTFTPQPVSLHSVPGGNPEVAITAFPALDVRVLRAGNEPGNAAGWPDFSRAPAVSYCTLLM
jgi:hypothetical protein